MDKLQCYNFKCTEDCDDFKIRYCINKINKEQFELRKEIGCSKCGSIEVKARKNKQNIFLCTVCGSIRRR